MKNNDFEPTKYTPSQEDSSYHTGPARPRKEHRGLIAVLMILVTFLGGIASALGIVNVRLLQKLGENGMPREHVAVYLDGSAASTGNDLHTAQTPSVPTDNSVQIPLETPGITPPQTPDPQSVLDANQESLVEIFCGFSTSSCESVLGVILNEQGYILTNAHSLSGKNELYVRLADDRCFRAALVGTDDFVDLAVLYVQADGLIPAHFATAGNLQNGDFLACLTDSTHLLTGSLTYTGEHTVGEERFSLLGTNFPEISGPVFNSCGQIVGFASPFFTADRGAGAVNSDILLEIAQQIIARGTITGRPCLGVAVEEVLVLHQQYWHLPEGLRVTRVISEEAAAVGILPGDIITHLNGTALTDRASFYAMLCHFQPGDTVTVTVVRGDLETTLTLTVQTSGNP